MHLVRTDQRSLDEAAQAVDLEQSPADVICLSFADSDLSLFAAAHDEKASEPAAGGARAIEAPLFRRSAHRKGLRARPLRPGAAARRAGLLALWRRGIGRRGAQARLCARVIPGDTMEDARLDQASTLPLAGLRQIWAYFREGGPENIAACLDFVAAKFPAATPAPLPRPAPPFGRFMPGCLPGGTGAATRLRPVLSQRFSCRRLRAGHGPGVGAGARKFSRAELLRLQPERRFRLRAAR